jgi:quercetin dioxygenase-like cupin family protein
MRLAVLLVASALLGATQPAFSDDPVKLSPKMYRVLFENDHVRVLEFRAKAGEKEPMHSHPAMVVYAVAGSKIRLSTPDGRSEELETRPGTAIWSEAVTHAYENLGPPDAQILLIEMKGLAQAGRAPAK